MLLVDIDFIALFDDLHTAATMDIFRNMAKSKRRENLPERPKTLQRTYRFDTKVFEAFEEDCARHLSNPKRVIEALILHWLDSGPDARAAMAKTHRERIGASSRDDE